MSDQEIEDIKRRAGIEEGVLDRMFGKSGADALTDSNLPELLDKMDRLLATAHQHATAGKPCDPADTEAAIRTWAEVGRLVATALMD